MLNRLIRENGTLTSLNLSHNRLGDEGCAAIAQTIRAGAMPNLTSLRLTGNSIGDRGMAALAEALASANDTHRSLTDIRINSNPAGAGAHESVHKARSV